jgi:hypothetical protein
MLWIRLNGEMHLSNYISENYSATSEVISCFSNMIEATFMCMNFITAQLHGVIIQIKSMHFSVAMVINQQ